MTFLYIYKAIGELAIAGHYSIHWACKYWFLLWNTFDYQFCIVWYTNSSFCPNHAAIVASVPLRSIYHTKKSDKSAKVEHFYVLQRCIPYINTLGEETKIKNIVSHLKKKKKILTTNFIFLKFPKRGGKIKAEVCICYFYRCLRCVRFYCFPMWVKPFIISGQPLIWNSCFQLFID